MSFVWDGRKIKMLYSRGWSGGRLARMCSGFRGERPRPRPCVVFIKLPQLLRAHQHSAQKVIFQLLSRCKKAHVQSVLVWGCTCEQGWKETRSDKYSTVDVPTLVGESFYQRGCRYAMKKE